MKICAVQYRSVFDDLRANIERQLDFVQAAAKGGAELIFFPELSLTGYRPATAAACALEAADPALEVFQQASDSLSVRIAVSAPLKSNDGVRIGQWWFAPRQRRRTYAKQILHEDELPYFARGDAQLIVSAGARMIAPAICFESLQESHAARAAQLGANVYAASVAKSAAGIARARVHYPEIARRHGMFVVMSNSVGPVDDYLGAGGSAAWGPDGKLLAELDGNNEGLLIAETA
jgi:predicted amidohydrolase